LSTAQITPQFASPYEYGPLRDLHIPIADVDDWLYSTGAGKDTQGGYTLRLFDELAQARQKN
jgi:hypothetical protein